MIKEYRAYYSSEIGLIEIIGTENGILSLGFLKEKSMNDSEIHPCLEECIEQIDEYFRGTRREFSINLQLQGTDFQKSGANHENTSKMLGGTLFFRD